MNDDTALYVTAGQRVCFTYTNWRGQTADRHVEMNAVYWGTTEHHPEPQWLLQAFDIEKKEHRVFAMRHIWDVRDVE